MKRVPKQLLITEMYMTSSCDTNTKWVAICTLCKVAPQDNSSLSDSDVP